MSTYTPWGEAQSVTNVMRGIRLVSTAGHGGVMVSKSLAEKQLPKAVRDRAIQYGGCYCFEEDIEWRWVAICICSKLATIPYDELVKTTARVAVEYGLQNVYVSACVMAGVGADVAHKNMMEYVLEEGTDKVRRQILGYADEFEATGKKGWVDYVHEAVMGVAALLREKGVNAKSTREKIFSVGKALVESGSVGKVQNAVFLKYGYNVDNSFLPVYLFTAA